MSQSVSRQLVNLVQTVIATLSDIIEIAMLEAKLAGKSLVVLAILFVFTIILLSSLWLCFLAIVFLLLTTMGLLKSIGALVIIAVLNIILLIAVFFVSKIYGQNFTFNATKKQLTFSTDSMEKSNESIKNTNSAI